MTRADVVNMVRVRCWKPWGGLYRWDVTGQNSLVTTMERQLRRTENATLGGSVISLLIHS